MKRHAIWLFARDMQNVDFSILKEAEVTDIFLSFVAWTNNTHRPHLDSFYQKCKENKIRLSMWTQALYLGRWYNPTTAEGKMRIETYLRDLEGWIKLDSVEGIHIDYIRFPGTAHLHTGATAIINDIMKRAHEIIKKEKPLAPISAAVMPEGNINARFYGQDYAVMGKYCDVLCPMTYTGNYSTGPGWVGTQTKYIKGQTSPPDGAEVWPGLQTYESDNDISIKSSDDMLAEAKSAKDGGAEGIVLFRHGLINPSTYQALGKLITPSVEEPEPPAPEPGPDIKPLSEVLDAAKRCAQFIQDNGRIPKFVTVAGDEISPHSFNRMLAAAILEIDSGRRRNILNQEIEPPTRPSNNIKQGELPRKDYIDAAQRTYDFMMDRGTAPNYTRTPLGDMGSDSFMDIYSRVLNFYTAHQRLPQFVYTNSVANTISPPQQTVPSNLSPYLTATRNCEVTHPTIQNLANQLRTPENMFYWVRNNISYLLYYNTRYGAVGTLSRRVGNCCDQTHLLNALLRARGYPALYRHVRADYGRNTYGHIYTRYYHNGTWANPLDPSSPRNTFNSINAWRLVSILNNYRELPF